MSADKDKDQQFIAAVERGMPTAMAARAIYGPGGMPTPTPPTPPAAADSGTPASPRRTLTGGTTDSVAIHRSAQQETYAAPDVTAEDGQVTPWDQPGADPLGDIHAMLRRWRGGA